MFGNNICDNALNRIELTLHNINKFKMLQQLLSVSSMRVPIKRQGKGENGEKEKVLIDFSSYLQMLIRLLDIAIK